MTLGSGVAGFGSSWVNAVFDDVLLSEQQNAPSTSGSFLFDCLAGQKAINLTGWAGIAVEAKAPVSITRIGRYKTRGNSRAHPVQVFRRSDAAAMLPADTNATVDMSCEGDLLGMCYTALFAPLRLVPGEVYYIVAEESQSGDMVTEMGDSARETTHAHRDGSTIMSYQGPGLVEVIGRVSGPDGPAWLDHATVAPELDTSFGPMNFVLAN